MTEKKYIKAHDELPHAPRDSERLWHALILVRYLLPLFSALVLLILGAFYNVSALQTGKGIKISVLRLCFNTLKSARAYLMGDQVMAGTRNFYLFLVVGAVLFILLFLVSVALAVLSVYLLRRAAVARAAGDREAEKEAKILLRAFLPNRIWMALANILLLPLALYPEFFSFVCSRFLTVSGGTTVYVRFNATAIVVGVLLLITVVLAVCTRSRELALGLDMFDVEEEEDEKSKESCGEENTGEADDGEDAPSAAQDNESEA